jgi:predicted amidohydrolase YtcJ
VRVVCLRRLNSLTPEALVDRAAVRRPASTDRLRLGAIKVVVDGSIQGFSARLADPGYHNGAPNGLWYVTAEEVRATLEFALARGLQVHLHTNGDQATELVLDCAETVLGKNPSTDHRITLQHAQLAGPAHFRRMKTLGMCVNLFANHLFYWGDQHHATTVGPERAQRMNACATALQAGVPLAIHSDAPVTPLGPLFTAWCAVNRRSATGRVLGENERISVDAALRAITLGAAYTLKLEPEIGSIEPGKRADFAVLEDDPAQIDPQRLKDVRIWGTVQGGRVFPAAHL